MDGHQDWTCSSYFIALRFLDFDKISGKANITFQCFINYELRNKY